MPSDMSSSSETSMWHKLKQQQLPAWKPTVSTRGIVGLYMAFGGVFIAVGVFLFLESQSVREYSADYTDVETSKYQVGSVMINIDQDMPAPIYLYYQLENFYQNHRRYVKSKDDNQLKGVQPLPMTKEALDSGCSPWTMAEDGRPHYPCGLIARSVFNDSFLVSVPDGDSWKHLDLDESASTIAWPSDVRDKFRNVNPEAYVDRAGHMMGTSEASQEDLQYQEKMEMWIVKRFPPVKCVEVKTKENGIEHDYVPVYVAEKTVKGKDGKEFKVADCEGYSVENHVRPTKCRFERKGQPFDCRNHPRYKEVKQEDWGVESGHFIVWMRVAGLPKFRKLFGKIDKDLEAGTKLKVTFVDNFPVKSFNGRKAIVLSTATWMGGKNSFLAYGYIVVGAICFVFGLFVLIRNQGRVMVASRDASRLLEQAETRQ